MAKIYIIAGEPSGDAIGAKIINHIKALSSHVSFYGIGGQEMQKTGLTSLFPMGNISLFGFLEILPHLFNVIKLINLTVKDILDCKPNIVVTIDSPGFCFRVAKKLKKLNFNTKLIHIVAPTVWAYKPKRAIKFALVYDHLLSILPFEPPLFEKYNLKTTYIGHPVFEQNFDDVDVDLFKKKHNIPNSEKIICVTPGSRKSEIIRLLPIFLSALEKVAREFDVICLTVIAVDHSN